MRPPATISAPPIRTLDGRQSRALLYLPAATRFLYDFSLAGLRFPRFRGHHTIDRLAAVRVAAAHLLSGS
jgi:hypothetical protein